MLGSQVKRNKTIMTADGPSVPQAQTAPMRYLSCLQVAGLCFVPYNGRSFGCCVMPAEPYVTKAFMNKLFGPELAAEVAARYFIEGEGPGGFRFRPEYYSEKVLWELKARPGSPDWLVEEVAKTRKGLLTLRQNLLLVRDPENPERLYPRFGLMGTSSYKELADAGWKSALSQLHDDYFYK